MNSVLLLTQKGSVTGRKDRLQTFNEIFIINSVIIINKKIPGEEPV
jgi:hypothetical protein